VGKSFYGVKVEDGANNLALIDKADVVLVTSSAFVNGTIYPILEEAMKRGKRVALYGVSGKGAYALLRKKVEWLAGVEYYCPFSSLKGSAPRVIPLPTAAAVKQVAAPLPELACRNEPRILISAPHTQEPQVSERVEGLFTLLALHYV